MAAGYGTRLAPLTNTTPKCLIPINNKPMLSYWEDLFIKYGIDSVLINTHYLNNQVHEYIKNHPLFQESYEPQLLGSAGTIFKNSQFITDTEPFLICYADNLTNINLYDLVNYHQSKHGLLTMALFEAPNPTECGIAKVDGNNKIINFIEKPKHPDSNLANGGIYVTDYRIFNYLNKSIKDFGKEVLPKLPNIYGYKKDFYLRDIGTLTNYNKAQEDVTNGLFRID